MSQSETTYKNDKAVIDDLTQAFFNAFTTRSGHKVDLDIIRQLFIPQALIIKHCDSPEVYDLEGFIAPREQLLNQGRLIDFSEQELSEETRIFGHIAQRFCVYGKSGCLDGQTFEAQGRKTIQFIKMNGSWKMSSVSWDDET